jgi:hypothetical protein
VAGSGRGAAPAAVRSVGGVEDQAPLVGRARRGDARDFQTPQLDHGPTLRPQGGDVVRRVASLGQLQEKPERYRAGPQPSFKLLAEEVRAALAGFVRGKKGLACLRHKATAAESARTSGEAEGVLGMVDRPQTATGRSRRGRSGERPGPVALN